MFKLKGIIFLILLLASPSVTANDLGHNLEYKACDILTSKIDKISDGEKECSDSRREKYSDCLATCKISPVHACEYECKKKLTELCLVHKDAKLDREARTALKDCTAEVKKSDLKSKYTPACRTLSKELTNLQKSLTTCSAAPGYFSLNSNKECIQVFSAGDFISVPYAECELQKREEDEIRTQRQKGKNYCEILKATLEKTIKLTFVDPGVSVDKAYLPIMVELASECKKLEIHAIGAYKADISKPGAKQSYDSCKRLFTRISTLETRKVVCTRPHGSDEDARYTCILPLYRTLNLANEGRDCRITSETFKKSGIPEDFYDKIQTAKLPGTNVKSPVIGGDKIASLPQLSSLDERNIATCVEGDRTNGVKACEVMNEKLNCEKNYLTSQLCKTIERTMCFRYLYRFGAFEASDKQGYICDNAISSVQTLQYIEASNAGNANTIFEACIRETIRDKEVSMNRDKITCIQKTIIQGKYNELADKDIAEIVEKVKTRIT